MRSVFRILSVFISACMILVTLANSTNDTATEDRALYAEADDNIDPAWSPECWDAHSSVNPALPHCNCFGPVSNGASSHLGSVATTSRSGLYVGRMADTQYLSDSRDFPIKLNVGDWLASAVDAFLLKLILEEVSSPSQTPMHATDAHYVTDRCTRPMPTTSQTDARDRCPIQRIWPTKGDMLPGHGVADKVGLYLYGRQKSPDVGSDGKGRDAFMARSMAFRIRRALLLGVCPHERDLRVCW